MNLHLHSCTLVLNTFTNSESSLRGQRVGHTDYAICLRSRFFPAPDVSWYLDVLTAFQVHYCTRDTAFARMATAYPWSFTIARRLDVRLMSKMCAFNFMPVE